ncbi:hypothetical protein BVY04_00390 [bacterium M21]|nr:hypothetical protein BVY04_00390 [bacterium M21]
MPRKSKITIPQLSDDGIHPGGSDIANRSWKASGHRRYQRLSTGESIGLGVEFNADVSEPEQVIIQIERISGGHIEPQQFTMTQQQVGFYSAKVQINEHGVHRFKVKYLKDDVWYWDSAPFGWLMIDSAEINKLRIYTFIPPVSGCMKQWRTDLQRAADMGFNAVHILPITTMGFSESPYAAHDLFSVDPSYHDPESKKTDLEQLREVVELAKKLGLRLFFDLVLNHVCVDSILAKRRPHWLEKDMDETDGIKRAGWSDGTRWHKWRDVGLLDYEPSCKADRDGLWEYITAYGLFWAEMAAETGGGLRLDNLHSSHPGFISHILSEIRNLFPDIIVLGEFFGDWDTMEQRVLEYGLDLLTATPWELKFAPHLRGHIKHLHESRKRFRFYFPACSHDSGGPVDEYGNVRAILPRLAISALMGPGPWGVTQGTEFAVENKINFIGRREQRTRFPKCPEFMELLTWLNELVENNSTIFLHAGNIRFLKEDHDAVITVIRLDPTTGKEAFLIAANMDPNNGYSVDIDLDRHLLKRKAPFIDMKTKEAFDVSKETLIMQVPAAGCRVYQIPEE